MAGLQSGFWQDMATTDFEDLDPENVIALFPVAAIEQHGPHLPLFTDACIAEGIVDRLLVLLPDSLTVLVLPTLAVGDSTEHGAFPGTLSLSPDTLIRVWTEVGESVGRAGVRKLVILNSHGGQPQIVDIVAQRLRLAHRMLVVKANSYALGVPHGLFDDAEIEHGIHAGGVETSVMLHLRPDLVRQEKVANFRPLSQDMAEEYDRLRPVGPLAFAWAIQDLSLCGACGDASDADAERGELIVDHAARELVTLLLDVQRFPLAWLRDSP